MSKTEKLKTIQVYETDWRKLTDIKHDNDLPSLAEAVRLCFKLGEEA